MKKTIVLVTVCLFALLSSINLHATGSLSVTIIPSDTQVIAVDGTVNLICKPSGGCEPYTYTWTIPGASGNPPTSVKKPGNVAFGSSAEGKVNTVTVEVADDNGNTARASVEVGVPKFQQTKDIWYFDDGDGDAAHLVTQDITVDGMPSGKSVTWKIIGQSDAIMFNNNQQEITGTDITRTIYSQGWSKKKNNLTINLFYNGTTVATSDPFTVRTPTKISEQVQPHINANGFKDSFTYTVRDNFGDLVTQCSVCEVFGNPNQWAQDYPNTTWNLTADNYGNGSTDDNGQFVDNYGYATTSTDVPQSVNPGAQNESTLVIHNSQIYKMGGSGDPGVSASGFQIYDTGLQFCRGRAYHY